MAIPHPRRPAGVSRMLRAQARSSPRAPSLKELVDTDQAQELGQRVYDLLNTESPEKAQHYIEVQHPALLRAALRQGCLKSFHALLGSLSYQGNPLQAPEQTVSWMLEAAQKNPDVWDFSTSRPQGKQQCFLTLRLSPQTLSPADWIRHAVQGMPLNNPEHDLHQTSWFQGQWKEFMTEARHQRRLIQALLDAETQASTRRGIHRSLHVSDVLADLTPAERETFAARLSDQVLKRLRAAPDGLTVRGLGQWVIELRTQALALAHPLQGIFAQHLCKNPTTPSNASHQTGAWGLLYRLYQAAPQQSAPTGFDTAWTPECAEQIGALMGQALQRYIDRDPNYGTLQAIRWQATVQGLLNEACLLERGLVAWGVQLPAHQRAYRAGLAAGCSSFADLLGGAPLAFDEPDSRNTWQQVNQDLHQEWHTRDRALRLSDALPTPTRRSSLGPRF